jgi:hypothetical protein
VTDHRAEANRIKERIRACESAESVRKVAAEERGAFQALVAAGGDARTYAVQISNLKVWKIDRLEKENET